MQSNAHAARHVNRQRARAAAHIQDIARRADGRGEVAAQHIAQHEVLEVEAIDLTLIFGQHIGGISDNSDAPEP